MWSTDVLRAAGLELDPRKNAFTYTFPPSGYARTRGRPLTDADSSLVANWERGTLYIHIPFCEISCTFCSLHRVVPRSMKTVTRYLEALKSEIQAWGLRLSSSTISEIYIGGGTPSCLPAVDLRGVLDLVAQSFTLSKDVEICIECAPSEGRTSSQWSSYFRELHAAGASVNRVSLGVQSWQSAALTEMGRQGGRAAVLDLLAAVDSIFTDYNIDFILGYPRRTHGIEANAESIIDACRTFNNMGYRIPSVSVYQIWDAHSIRAGRSRFARFLTAEQMMAEKWRLQTELFDLGYGPSAGATFLRKAAKPHRWAMRRCKDFRHAGIGSGSYTILPTGIVVRDRNLKSYIECGGQMRHLNAMSHYYRASLDERKLRRMILGIRSCEPTSVPADFNNQNLEKELVRKLGVLCDVGLLRSTNGELQLAHSAFMLSNQVSAYLHPTALPRKEAT